MFSAASFYANRIGRVNRECTVLGGSAVGITETSFCHLIEVKQDILIRRLWLNQLLLICVNLLGHKLRVVPTPLLDPGFHYIRHSGFIEHLCDKQGGCELSDRGVAAACRLELVLGSGNEFIWYESCVGKEGEAEGYFVGLGREDLPDVGTGY